MTHENRKLAIRWFEEVWNQGRREVIAEMLPPDGVIFDGATASTGPDGFYPFFDRMRDTFSGMHLTIEKTIVEEDHVCVRWSCSMKHTGDGLGIKPTHKTVSITGISIIHFAHGKVVQGWQNWDMFGLMQQLQESANAPPIYLGAAAV